MTDWTALTDALVERSGGRCESCGMPVSLDDAVRHHRLLRKHGGKHVLSNLLLLHPRCHHAIHFKPEASYASGHLVRAEAMPGDVPLYVPGFGWVRLADDATDYLVDRTEDEWLG